MPPPLVPELYVTHLQTSLEFYVGLLAFTVLFERTDEKFAYLQRDRAELMLEEPIGRTWLAAPLERPFGRGMNLQIDTHDVEKLYDRCCARDAPIFLALETHSYRQATADVSVRQFIVQDPDGYLLRFSQRLGERAGDGE